MDREEVERQVREREREFEKEREREREEKLREQRLLWEVEKAKSREKASDDRRNSGYYGNYSTE